MIWECINLNLVPRVSLLPTSGEQGWESMKLEGNIVENFSLFINSLTSTGHVICDLKLKHLFIWK